MANIEKIQIGANTTPYNISDVTLRTSAIKAYDFKYDTESGAYAANKKIYHWILNVDTAKVYGSRIFAIYRADIYRQDDASLWTKMKIRDVSLTSSNTITGSEGYQQNYTACGECGGANGPKKYALTCCDNVYLETPKWSFYVFCGQSFKTRYHYLSLYFFNSCYPTIPGSVVTTASGGGYASFN